MKGRTYWIGLFVACSIGVCSGAAAAQPAAPPAGYKIEEEHTHKSPDGAMSLDVPTDIQILLSMSTLLSL